MKNKELLESAGLTANEIQRLELLIDNKEDSIDFCDTTMFEKLYNYFLDENKMPYGVAKARTGDPCYWILDQLS
tara:strand:- start:89 stop:310 length:222 start_codon:yes stop_codon:yes gene_type:complete